MYKNIRYTRRMYKHEIDDNKTNVQTYEIDDNKTNVQTYEIDDIQEECADV